MSSKLGAASVYTESLLGGMCVPNYKNPVSIVGALNVLAADPERVSWEITNLSANDMYLGYGSDVGTTNGILLSGNGGYVSMHVIEDFQFVTWPVFVYSVAAGNQLYITSQRRQTLSKEG